MSLKKIRIIKKGSLIIFILLLFVFVFYINTVKVNAASFKNSKISVVKTYQLNSNTNCVCWKKLSGAQRYKLYVLKKGKYKVLTSTENNCYYHTGVKTGATYYYKVRAWKIDGNKKVYSKYSNVVTKFIKPWKTRINVIVSGNNALYISFKNVSNISYYEIWRSTNKNGKYYKIKTLKKNSYSNNSLKKRATYCYKVRTVKTSGREVFYSYWSNKVCETTTERNAKYRLKLTSVYGDVEAYHPSVLYFANGWKNYKYWLTFTPYPSSDATKENPHIKVSNDLKNWVTPTGLVNPLDSPSRHEFNSASKDTLYNSDGEIVYNNDLDRIECYWRRYNRNNDSIILYMKYTEDGINWSEKQIIKSMKLSENLFLSPSIIYDNGIYKLWYIRNNSIYYEEYDGVPFITRLKKQKLNVEADTSYNINPWHLDVNYINGTYEILYVGKKDNDNTHKMNLYYTKSNDNISYSNSKAILGPSIEKNAWDNRGIYRSSFFYQDGKYYIIYSASNTSNIKGTSILYGKYLSDLYPLFN